MTLAEFKAWFEGYKEAIDGVPNEKQWARICEKLEKVNEPVPVSLKRDPMRRETWMDDKPPYVARFGQLTAGDVVPVGLCSTCQA